MSKSAGIAGLFQAFVIEKRLQMAARWGVKIQNNYLKDYMILQIRVKENTVRIRLWIIVILLLGFTSTALAELPHLGASVAVPIFTKDPQYLHAYKIGGWYQPQRLRWQQIHIYLDFSAGHWWVTNTNINRSINIYAIAPVFRCYFTTQATFSPFVNLSIGAAYLSRTHFDHQNLGMHFAFQDQVGIGATFGRRQEWTVIASALHYSNGSLSKKNAGITVPLILTAEYGFA